MSYITMKNLGGSGDLGSQIQQYCSLLAISKVSGKELVFCEEFKSYGFGIKFINLLDIELNLKPIEFFNDFMDIAPNEYCLKDDLVYSLLPDKNYNFIHRFNLFHYWKDIIDVDINFRKNVLEESTEKIEEIKKLFPNKELVSIHVRRGDYLLPQHSLYHNLGESEYYMKALFDNFHREKCAYVVFSNDIEWCKEFLFGGKNVVFSEKNNDYVDLCMMSLCDHNIIANSSFSWWGAYLNKNKNKKVVCPQNYIKSSHSLANIINKNYYPPEWVSIYND